MRCSVKKNRRLVMLSGTISLKIDSPILARRLSGIKYFPDGKACHVVNVTSLSAGQNEPITVVYDSSKTYFIL